MFTGIVVLSPDELPVTSGRPLVDARTSPTPAQAAIDADSDEDLRRRPVKSWVWVTVVGLFVVHLLGLTLHPLTGVAHQLFSDLMQEAAGLFATVAALVTSRRLHGRQRVVWVSIGGALLINVAFNVAGDAFSLVGTPSASVGVLTAFGPVLAIPFAIVGAAALVSTYIKVSRTRTAVDAFIASGAVYMVTWLLLLRSVVEDSRGDPSNIIPPLVDVLYAILIIFVAVRTRRDQRFPLLLIVGGQLFNTVTDMVLSYLTIQHRYVAASPLEVGWTLAFLLIGLAALYTKRIPENERNNQPASQLVFAVLPYVAVCIGAIAATVAQVTEGALDPFMTWTAIGLMVLLSIRQYLALRENQQLTKTLETSADALRKNEERFRKLVSHSSDIIAVVDDAGITKYITPAVERLLGLSIGDMLQKPLADYVHPSDIEALDKHIRRVALGKPGGVKTLVFRIRDHSLGWHTFEATTSNMLDEDGVNGIVLNTRDITERQALENELRFQAFHDPLTRLANRSLLQDRLTHAIERQIRRHEEVALILIDLDDFKRINDSMGHAAGDELLCEAAERMMRCLRESDTGSRLGGDEFALLLEGGSTKLPVETVVQRILRSLEQPMTLAGTTMAIHASAGVAVSRGGLSANELLRRADIAMYRAKERGKNQYVIDDAASADPTWPADAIADVLPGPGPAPPVNPEPVPRAPAR